MTTQIMGKNVYLYGPPGSGKSSLGKALAGRLGRDFVDLDEAIAGKAGCSIPEIFANEGEKGFRARELAALEEVGRQGSLVVALGGGALLAQEARDVAERTGKILFLDVPQEVLERRIMAQAGTRPLADRLDKIRTLMGARRAHYGAFPRRLVQEAADGQEDIDARAGKAEIALGMFHIASGDVPSDVVVENGIVGAVGALARQSVGGTRAVVVADENTAPLYAARVGDAMRKAGYEVAFCTIPAGETTKTIDTVGKIWSAFLKAGLARKDVAVAVGGGVTGDLTGFAAASWMRGINWINVPTSLLAMVDASTGGKTGCDLAEGKNLVGAFHSPRVVAIDPETLATLPRRELACGWAEAVKHAILDDPGLWERMAGGGMDLASAPDAETLARILAVKVRTVRLDPKETKGLRAKLNLGHTFAHALEIATDFALKHGEAVAIGTVAAARLARKVFAGETAETWPEEVEGVFAKAGLPVAMPEGLGDLREIMLRDKKKAAGTNVNFVLPVRCGDVRIVKMDLAKPL